ncbi:MAG: transcriptional regulator [Oscillospiraceae bacterium]|nr:transcriptional regulator [Oscillospiraceae bacterium]
MQEKLKLSDKVVMQLQDMISVQKTYTPGDKLPNEKELAVELGVSRTTVREAIQYLVTQNVLEIRRGKGTFVSETSAVSNEFGFDALKYMHLKLRDLYELRLMLEPQMAYYAALRAADSEIQEILQIGNNIEQGMESKEEDAEGNEIFHNSIAKATHNEFGIKVMELINSALVTAFEDSDIKQKLFDDTIMDHKMIMNYLQLRDAEGVKHAMYLHIKHSMKDYGLIKHEE